MKSFTWFFFVVTILPVKLFTIYKVRIYTALGHITSNTDSN